MNCDRIAGAYRWLEYLVFGRALERCRCHFLSSIDRRQNALLLGDGDGRFLVSYLRANPTSRVDSLDISGEMQALARRRAAGVSGGIERVRFICSDARITEPSTVYDLVVTHFFLDCLREDEIDALAAQLRQTVQPHAVWLVSEFRIPAGSTVRPLASALIRVMYEFFARFTGIQTRCLPDHRGILERQGFQLRQEHLRIGGLLVSELWEIRPAEVALDKPRA